MTNDIIQNILHQQKILSEKIPNLKNYFIDIFIPQWNATIPFLPIRCFRDYTLHSFFTEETSSTNESEFKTFLSSGSTGNKRSQHIFSKEALKNYELNSCKGFSRFLNYHNLSQDIPIISLIPTTKVWPTSSLAAMMEMFARNNFQVICCDIEQKRENLISCLKTLPEHSNCLIFGTTFHHLMLVNEHSTSFQKEIQAQFKRLNISIVDTGGTKGRTQAFTLQETIEAFKNFYSSQTFSFFSEYGMCELSSQAWSKNKIHDGSFICNETLIPFSISIEKKQALNFEEKGFIAFIDIVNQESWEAIITEDIGYTTTNHSFYLIGRGPDASIKGCSLNVRNYFNFDSAAQEQRLVSNFSLENQSLIFKGMVKSICKILKEEKNWDFYSIHDFEKIASSIENGIPINAHYNSKKMLIISAANTPIAWLFPYLIAARSKASAITIKVPSLRLDDYYTQNIINKTKDLIEIVSSYFPYTKTYIDSNKSIAHNFHNYDIVLTFGTDETLQTISQQVNKNTTEFIGKGDIKNSLCVNVTKGSLKLKEIVTYCSLWNGRGCLTPVVLFIDANSQEVSKWCKEFSTQLEKEFMSRWKAEKLNLVQEFVHSHNCAYVRGQIKQLGLNDESIIYRGKLTCVVNLTELSTDKLINFEPDFSFGGAGFIYLFPYVLKENFNTLKELSILPKIEEWG